MYSDAVEQNIRTMERAQAAEQITLRTMLTTGSLKDKEWWSTIKVQVALDTSLILPHSLMRTAESTAPRRAKSEYFGNFFSQKCSLGDNGIDPSSLPRAK